MVKTLRSSINTGLRQGISVSSMGGGGGGGSSNTCIWSMRYHMFGADQGTFEVYVEQSGSFTRILQEVGQQHTSESDEYDLLTYDLMPSFAG